ncbi:hypothetical protein BDR22DRAFT_885186 [Usnea florida]
MTGHDTHDPVLDANRVSKDNNDAREARNDSCSTLVNNYYDIVTDLYEEGWGQSFRLFRIAVGESLLNVLTRHEHYLAYKMGIQEGMTVLDVGSGVRKPAQEIATFSGCNVVGLNLPKSTRDCPRQKGRALAQGFLRQA